MGQQITVSLTDKTAAAIKALSPDLETFVVAVVEQEIARRAQLTALPTSQGYGRIETIFLIPRRRSSTLCGACVQRKSIRRCERYVIEILRQLQVACIGL